jgi:arylsulfatase A-like enzyme
MRAILVMYDTLNRRLLEPYGCDWVQTPNFNRLAEKTATFDTMYIGSSPTMPTRRELHTGRYSFIHRSWGPLEPFDDSMPAMLDAGGVTTHLISDGYHYWEDGGATYHNRYTTWDFMRGQEGDKWKGDRGDPDIPRLNEHRKDWGRQDWVNRSYMQDEADHMQSRTFSAGLDLVRKNAPFDNWLIQIETFDPHEPYFAPKRFLDQYGVDLKKFPIDWPGYKGGEGMPPEQGKHLRACCAALTSFCDYSLGRVLDTMDELGLWKDTMLIVNTDHGFMLGERNCWGKCWQPYYDEIARMPLFVWDPRAGVAGERRKSLAQTIDLAPTLLEFFGVDRAPDMLGTPLKDLIATDAPVREAGLFGGHGVHMNVTDGRYVYMRAPAAKENGPLFDYTLMPTKMRGYLPLDRLAEATLAPPFSFTKGCPVLKIPVHSGGGYEYGTRLFDTEADPGQETPLSDGAVEKTMVDHLVRLLQWADAPAEQFVRLGLEEGER